jgi:hypothetical protein
MLKVVSLKLLCVASVLGLLAACAGPAQHVDYTAIAPSE